MNKILQHAYLIVLLAGTHIGVGQQVRVGLQTTGGIGAGWWVYNKGFTSDGFHQGYDRTHLAFSIPLEGEGVIQKGRWALSLGGGLRRLVDNVMIASDHQSTARHRYRVSEEDFLRLRHIHIGLAYHLVSKRRYQLSPTLRLGSFWFQHIHPAADRMGFPLMMDIGISQLFPFGARWALLLEGRYSDWRVWGNESSFRGEQHHIYTIDLRIGLRCWLNVEKHPQILDFHLGLPEDRIK